MFQWCKHEATIMADNASALHNASVLMVNGSNMVDLNVNMSFKQPLEPCK